MSDISRRKLILGASVEAAGLRPAATSWATAGPAAAASTP